MTLVNAKKIAPAVHQSNKIVDAKKDAVLTSAVESKSRTHAKITVHAVNLHRQSATNAKLVAVKMVVAKISAEIAKTTIARTANANQIVHAARANLKKSRSAIVKLDAALMAAAVKKELISAKTTVHAVNLVQLPLHVLEVAVLRATKRI